MYYTSNLTNNILGKLHSWGKCDIITGFGDFWDGITYAEIFDWFIDHDIWIAMYGGNMWDWRIIAKDRCMTIGTTLFKTFQEAADDAIERSMRIFKGTIYMLAKQTWFLRKFFVYL